MAEEKKGHMVLEPKVHAAGTMQYLDVDVPSVYSNNVMIKFTNWDAGILFGEIVSQGIGENETLVIRPRVRIMMSHSHLKAFAEALQATLESFENAMGDIKIISASPSASPSTSPSVSPSPSASPSA
jgi:hypothetical protein